MPTSFIKIELPDEGTQTMFGQIQDEQLMVMALKAFIEEWGAPHVTVCVPKSWRADVEADHLGKVRLTFETENTLRLRVDCDDVHLTRDFPIKAAVYS